MKWGFMPKGSLDHSENVMGSQLNYVLASALFMKSCYTYKADKQTDTQANKQPQY